MVIDNTSKPSASKGKEELICQTEAVILGLPVDASKEGRDLGLEP